MTLLVMPHITRLKQIGRKYNLIVIFIIDFNDHYIHFKEKIIEIPLFYNYTDLIEYKFVNVKKPS